MWSIRHIRTEPALPVYVIVPFLLSAFLFGFIYVSAPPTQSSDRVVVAIRIAAEAITPVSAGFIERALAEATESRAVCLVIELDTPGGLMESTRDIVKNILASSVPVVVYVAPSGARAASAGVFITLSAHVAAMAPATHIGAAHPVQIGQAPGRPSEQEPGEPTSGRDVMEDKIVNDASAWAESLAELRGRNAEWAVAAVRESVSVPSSEALTLNIIDFVADNLPDLLSILDGMEVDLETGPTTLHTEGAVVRTLDMWWGERILSVLSNPNIAFLLMMFGFYGIFFELYTPGWGIAGTIGAICLILAFYGLAVLPINYAGLVLIFLALGLFVAEAFFTSFGMLTIGGAICLILGGIMLVDSEVPVMNVSLSVLIPVAVATGIIAFFLAGRVLMAQRSKVQTGVEAMVGRTAIADEAFSRQGAGYEGVVLCHGELWRAVCDRPVEQGDNVRITQCGDLTLFVSHSTASGPPPEDA